MLSSRTLVSFRTSRLGLAGLAAAAILCLGQGVAHAQDGGDAPSDQQLLEDFNHYVFVANDELARSNAQALLDRGISPQEFVGLVEDSPMLAERFDQAYRRALVDPDLEDVAAELGQLYRQGRLARARNPEEISRNINALTGTKRGRVLATERLVFASQYAVPQLLNVLLEQRDERLELAVTSVLVEMGKDAIEPLCAALLHVEPSVQEKIALVLGKIPYRASLPYLEELYQTTTNESVRAAASVAIQNLSGRNGGTGLSVADLYRELGEQYYDESASLTTFPREEYQLLWEFESGGAGLWPTAIRTPVYHEARAMELASRALELDPNDQLAIALWLAANFSREIDQPADYDNPAYPAERRSAEYYAVAAGPRLMQRVLARALRDTDTPLARRAIAALDKSAGDAGLREALDGTQPLIDALTYPDRRVQYEAALALGRANPTELFPGAEQVVPTLASAIRDASKRYALVVARELEQQQSIRTALEDAGYIVLPPVAYFADAAVAIADAPGIDLVVSDLTGESTEDLIEQVRNSPRLLATPVLSLVSTAAIARIGGRFDADGLTRLIRRDLTQEQLVEAARQLVQRTVGEAVTPEQARAYSIQALGVLRDLAISGNDVLDVADATSSLLVSLNETEGDVRYRVADVLSYIPQQRAQVALMDAAMDAEGAERIELLGRVTDSAKRFGNLLESRQIRWLMEVVRTGDETQATSAAALAGALNLAGEELVPLILEP